MKYAAFGSFLAALLSSGVYGAPQAQQPSSAVTMNTPTNLITCEPVMLTWSGGTAPYFLSLQDGNNFNGPSLQHFDQQTGTSMSWTVNVPAGQSVAFLLRDTSGQTSLSAPVAVQGGTQDSCVNKSISFAPSSSGQASATGGATPPNTAAAGATPVTAPTQSRSSGSSPSKSTTAASSSSNAAAPKLAVSGVVIPALAALFGYIMA